MMNNENYFQYFWAGIINVLIKHATNMTMHATNMTMHATNMTMHATSMTMHATNMTMHAASRNHFSKIL